MEIFIALVIILSFGSWVGHTILISALIRGITLCQAS